MSETPWPAGQDPVHVAPPDINQVRAGYEGRLVLGRWLVLSWGYIRSDTGPPRLRIDVNDARVNTLATLAVLPVQEGNQEVPAQLIAEAVRQAADVARRLYPEKL